MSVPGVFVTGTGTGVGKTYVSRGLARAWRIQGLRVAALKPVETGYEDPTLSDAHALSLACGQPALRDARGFYRARLPLAPEAVTLEGGQPPPDVEDLANATRAAARGAQRVLVEGAGGVLVPLSQREDFADLARELALPLLLVAPNGLGVLSHLRTAHEAVTRRGLQVAAAVLVQLPEPDTSARTNAVLLREHLGVPVLDMPRLTDNDDALAAWAGILTAQL